MFVLDFIDLLKSLGIDFKCNEEEGIDVEYFGEFFIIFGFVFFDNIKWVFFYLYVFEFFCNFCGYCWFILEGMILDIFLRFLYVNFF